MESIMQLEEEETQRELEEAKQRRLQQTQQPTSVLSPSSPFPTTTSSTTATASRASPSNQSESSSPSPSLRMFQRPLNLLNRLFSDVSSVSFTTSTAPSTGGVISPVSPTNTDGPAEVGSSRPTEVGSSVPAPPATRRDTVVSVGKGASSSFYTSTDGEAAMEDGFQGYPGSSSSGRPALPDRPPVVTAPGEHPSIIVRSEDNDDKPFARDMSQEERNLLADYELQLAMALSLSMEAETEAQLKDQLEQLQQQKAIRHADPVVTGAAGGGGGAVGGASLAQPQKAMYRLDRFLDPGGYAGTASRCRRTFSFVSDEEWRSSKCVYSITVGHAPHNTSITGGGDG